MEAGVKVDLEGEVGYAHYGDAFLGGWVQERGGEGG